MNVTSKITENWWMIFKCFPPEPSLLWRLYIRAIFVTLGLFLLTGLWATFIHGFSKEPTIHCQKPICDKQKEDWKKLRAEAIENEKVASNRMELLKKVRSNPDANNIDKSWNWFETEINQLKEIIEKPKKLRIASVKGTFPILFISVFGSLLFFVLMSRLVLLHAKSVQDYFFVDKIRENIIRDWTLPQTLIGILIAFFMILAEVSTSVLASSKTSFGWDSYCVTEAAFIVKCISFISYGLAAATPFTVLWCLSRDSYIPIPDAPAQDGNFGAKRYVEFIQTWTLWLIIAPSTLGMLWIRYIGKTEIIFSHGHLFHGLGVVLIIVIIIIKLIRNAIILRFRCSKIMLNIEYSKIDRPPKDPTIDFLGTDWWKLPATIGVSLASIWALLEWLGIAKFITSIIR
jgi:hypothetical protein